jgi:hypothetical protein
MKVQTCAGIEPVEPSATMQEDMLRDQIAFQRRLGILDEKLSPLHPAFGSYSDVSRAIHNLDMARHEASEAYDMLEGGWKHHKTQPGEVDAEELLLELIDVLKFVFNACLQLGIEPSAHGVAKVVSSSGERKYVAIEWRHVWNTGAAAADADVNGIMSQYSHADGAHGPVWVKRTATRVNMLTSTIAAVADTLRKYLASGGERVPGAAGYVYSEIVPWLCGAAASIPGVTPELFYAAMKHKTKIINRRFDEGY